jgi:hypothetical protein
MTLQSVIQIIMLNHSTDRVGTVFAAQNEDKVILHAVACLVKALCHNPEGRLRV